LNPDIADIAAILCGENRSSQCYCGEPLVRSLYAMIDDRTTDRQPRTAALDSNTTSNIITSVQSARCEYHVDGYDM